MQEARNLREYKDEVREALDNEFQREALDKFALAYPVGRQNAFAGLEIDTLVDEVARRKDFAVAHMEELYQEFKSKAEAAGVHVHLARTAKEANDIIADIARSAGARNIIKSKSMTAEEILLNHHLEAEGFQVTETDLGEWIIQLRHEGPSHMVMPAIHLSRYQVADLFSDVTGKTQDAEIERLVKVARRELRQKFVEADLGVSGANFAVAETGTIGMTTNEGNARLVATLPRTHVVLAGLEKLVPKLHDALSINRVLPKNATGQAITSYVTWITGPVECGATPDRKKELHVVFLDNGRSRLARDPVFSQVLRCIRCGACANVCPVYRMVGGHRYGHIYIGAIGLIVTYFFHGREKARNLVMNCLNCGACKAVCAAGIDLPRLIKEVHTRIQDEEGHPLKGRLAGIAMKNRKLFHGLLTSLRRAQRPVTGGTQFMRHLPMVLFGAYEYMALPALAERPFRELWPTIHTRVEHPRFRVALFAGCLEDFVYPQHLIAAVRLFSRHGVDVHFPLHQTCCGLPLDMMGEKETARELAEQNLEAADPANYDYIVTLCASCASHLKNGVPRLLQMAGSPSAKAREFSEKILPFSSFAADVLKLGPDDFSPSNRKVTYHASCHLCRGLGVRKAPHELIRASGSDFGQASEEETCCGFGGTYASNFPQISERILKRKLADFQQTGADLLVTECPGCVLHLKGGVTRQGMSMEVEHLAEHLADQMKPGPTREKELR